MLCEKKPTRPITKLITAKMIVSVFKIFRNIVTILPLNSFSVESAVVGDSEAVSFGVDKED